MQLWNSYVQAAALPPDPNYSHLWQFSVTLQGKESCHLSTESVAWIQGLGHHCVVSLSTLQLPMCLVVGMFAALICPVILRGTREEKIFLASLTFKDLSSSWRVVFVDWFPPVKWDWQLELQLEVEGAMPRAMQGWRDGGLAIWLCLILVSFSWVWKLQETCCLFTLPGPSYRSATTNWGLLVNSWAFWHRSLKIFGYF